MVVASWGEYNSYATEEWALIRKYAAENGLTKAAKHYSEVLKGKYQNQLCRLKSEYLRKLNQVIVKEISSISSSVVSITVIETIFVPNLSQKRKAKPYPHSSGSHKWF